MDKHSSESVLSYASEADLRAAYNLTSEPGELIPPFFFRAKDGGLALIRKQGDRYDLGFYLKTAAGAEKVGEVTRIEALEDARTVARAELMLPLTQKRSFGWAKLKDDVSLEDGEAVSSASDLASPGAKRLPEGLLVRFVEAGTEGGKIVVEGQGQRFEISKRLLNLL